MTSSPAGKLGHLRGLPAAGAQGAAQRGGLLSTRVGGWDQLSCAAAVSPAAREFCTWSGGEFEFSWVLGLNPEA